MLPDFNRLKIFYHIYQAKSVSGGARSLHLTQSAVSQHLQKLEDELNTRLFTRLPRRLVPTHEGEKLFLMIHPFVTRLKSGLSEIETSRKHPAGLLRVGAPVEFGEGVLPKVMAGFIELYPAVRFELTLGHPETLLPLIRKGALDMAFSDIFIGEKKLAVETAGLSFIPVIDEELILIASTPYHKKHIGNRVTKKGLESCRFIAYHLEKLALKSWFLHHFKTASVSLRVVLTVESVQAIILAVKHHMGVGLVPEHLVAEDLHRGVLSKIQTRKKEMLNRIALVQLENKVPGITEKRFIDYFKKRLC